MMGGTSVVDGDDDDFKRDNDVTGKTKEEEEGFMVWVAAMSMVVWFFFLSRC